MGPNHLRELLTHTTASPLKGSSVSAHRADEVSVGEPKREESREVWPPRSVDPRPLLPGMEEAPLELSLDVSDPLPGDPDFTPSRFARHGIEAIPSHELSRPKTVVFDPKNPSGRTRRDRVLDANDGDFRRALFESRRSAAIAGAFAFACVLVFFGHFAPASWFFGCLAGAIAGQAARAAGDSAFSWAGSLAALGLLICVTKGVLIGCLVTAILAVAGWITGLVREST